MNARELVNYLAGLAENNNRAWFAMSKPSYDILRGEFTDLVAQVIATTAKFDPAVAGQEPKKAQFRINRDLRFSKDKSPYKTHFAAAIAPAGRKDPGSHYYFHVDHRGMLLVAGGCYMPPGDVLAKIRAHIANEPAQFKRLLGARSLWSHFGAFADEGKLSRPPKGFAPDTPHIGYIKQKSFVVWTEEPVKGKDGAALAKAITTGFKLSFPLIRWLREATAGDSSPYVMAPPDTPPPEARPPDPSAAPTRATLPQVASAVFWSFFGVRKGRHMLRDTTTINPLHVVIVGVVAGIVIVLTLLALVQVIMRNAG